MINREIMKRIIIFLIAITTLASCDFLDPRPIQDLTTDELWSHADYGEGILTTAYGMLETSYDINSDYYTDNAVPSTTGSNSIALGSWTLENSTIGNWDRCYSNLKYINLFLENGRTMPYNVTDAFRDSILRAYRTGEAYYLRGWNQWKLLQSYGGMVDGSSEALGFPIVTKPLEITDDLNIPRNTYEECVAQIVSDLDSAFMTLPIDYTSARDPYLGVKNRGRASGLAAKTLKARVYLYAASPAFGNSNQQTWTRAAQAAADAIKAAGGLKDLAVYGNYNDGMNFDNIWISTSSASSLSERTFYPPSLYGSGNCNPSQNLVDAFPAADGYPIDKSAVYSANQPYKNRDSRFEKFIFYNGNTYNKTVVSTYVGGADAPGGLSQKGTRTGYYMKKLLSDKVSLTPGSEKPDYKFVIYLSKAELYLNFAEAANEAFGPSDASLGFSALDVMKKIRKRGLGDINDKYMNEQASAGKDAFRAFIQNERRIELCFEGHRFWDVRRWNLPLNHTVKGVKINQNGGDFTYEFTTVEDHTYQDYMRYVPLPYSQTLIMSNLKQNSGWK
jgi:starch-binding outer membrane protein, SusD/RagB family